MEIKDRVLVIEDDKHICSFFKTILEANHYDVIIAHTGAEAYSLVTSQCPDIVILDLGTSGHGRDEDLKECPGMVVDADSCGLSKDT